MKVRVSNLFISPDTGRILCDPGKVLIGNSEGIAVPSSTIPIPGLPNLTYTKTWVGDAGNRPIELPYISAADFADVTFVLRTADPDLPNAEVLDTLGTGILKTIADGHLAIAIAETDYATPANLLFILGQIQGYAAAAAFSAGAAAASAVAAGLSAGAAAASAADAQNSADLAQLYYDNILATGLNALPNNGDIDIRGFRIKNLAQSPSEDFDAISFTFLWDLMHDSVDILFVSA